MDLDLILYVSVRFGFGASHLTDEDNSLLRVRVALRVSARFLPDAPPPADPRTRVAE